jgi:virulence factor Mce-like protein
VAARLAAAGSFVALALAIAAIVRSGGDDEHTLRASFTSAVQVVPGQQVRIAGRRVGRIASVGLEGGDAVLTLSIDDSAWPLRRGTIARLDFGQPASYASRFVTLAPGPRGQPPLSDGGILTTADTITPVEFDQIYRIFGPRTRRNFQAFISNAADTLDGRGANLARDLRMGAPGIRSLAGFSDDLAADPRALGTLVTAAARTTAALRLRDGALRGLITNTAETFDELAARARALQATLTGLPPTLRAGTVTLRRLDRSLTGLQALTRDLGPGARGLRRIAPAATRAVATLSDVAPLATSTLRSGTRSAPSIRRLLSRSVPFLPRLSAALSRAAPMLACVRPYGPEIVGQFSIWDAGSSHYDRVGHYGRALLEQSRALGPGSTQTSAEVVRSEQPGALSYAMPRPPGYNAGQPWFLPQCGVTHDALDPSKDPESRR